MGTSSRSCGTSSAISAGPGACSRAKVWFPLLGTRLKISADSLYAVAPPIPRFAPDGGGAVRVVGLTFARAVRCGAVAMVRLRLLHVAAPITRVGMLS